MNKIPYDLIIDQEDEITRKREERLERLYHTGQEKIWDGRHTLSEIVKKHGSVTLSEEKKRSLGKIFSLILWGEYSAWTISLQLAAEIREIGPRMAATSQAHDEARHFYVFRDYLKLLGPLPLLLPKSSENVINAVIKAPTLPKKLLGMQLMVEPVALTLFQLICDAQTEPILCDILEPISRDESRHMALGILHLPKLTESLLPNQLASLWLWQANLIMIEMTALRDMRDDMLVLGIDPDAALKTGIKRQMEALQEMIDASGSKIPIVPAVKHLISARQFYDKIRFPHS